MGADSGSRWLGGDPTANAGRAWPEVSSVLVPPAAGSRFPLRTHGEELPGSGETAAGNGRPRDASAPVLGWCKHPLQSADFLSAWNSSSSLFSFTGFVYRSRNLCILSPRLKYSSPLPHPFLQKEKRKRMKKKERNNWMLLGHSVAILRAAATSRGPGRPWGRGAPRQLRIHSSILRNPGPLAWTGKISKCGI